MEFQGHENWRVQEVRFANAFGVRISEKRLRESVPRSESLPDCRVAEGMSELLHRNQKAAGLESDALQLAVDQQS